MSTAQQKQQGEGNIEQQRQLVDVADVTDVPEGNMKHIEVGDKEILLANLDGSKVYALCDRCSHMNAPLSGGTLNGKVVTCAAHGARFDVTTGNKVAEPMALDSSKFPEPLPESLQKMFARSAEIMSKVKTYNQPIYETKVEGNRVKVRM
jgi:nitrite reductase/ring-hydroxylating ferredoxin subunit